MQAEVILAYWLEDMARAPGSHLLRRFHKGDQGPHEFIATR